jgi:hypothetical protein
LPDLTGFYRPGLLGPAQQSGYAGQASNLLGGSYGAQGMGSGPLGYYSDLAYKLAGSPARKPTQVPVGPFAIASGGGGGGGGGSALDSLQNVKKGYDAYQRYTDTPEGGFSLPLNQSAGQAFGTSASSALGANAAGSVPLFGAGAADLGTIGAGALFGTSGAAATGATAAGAVPLFGAGAADLGTIGAGQLFGTSANAALGSGAAGSAASGAGAAGAGAGTSALGTLGAGAGYAALAIGAGELIHSAFNAHGDEKRNVSSFLAGNPDIKTVNVTGAKGQQIPYYALPDGRVVGFGDLQDLAGAWYGATYAPDGDQAGWQQKYDTLNSGLKTSIPRGYIYKDGKLVRA